MAEIIAYRVTIEPVSRGTTVAEDSILRGATKSEGKPVKTVIEPSAAQIVGVQNYLALIKGGATTTTVESAINALTP